MRKILFFISLMTFIGTSGQNMGSKDFWIKDKIGHTMGTFGISSVTYAYLSIRPKHKNLNELQKRLISLSTAIITCALKEAFDSLGQNRVDSWKDMGANMTGILAFQMVVTIPLNKKRKKIKRRDIAYHKN